MKRKAKPRVLDDAAIDRYFAQAAATVREVRKQTASCFTIPASARSLVIR